MSLENIEGMKCDLNVRSEKNMTRRDFLGVAALWSFITAWILTFIGLGKFPMPALLPDISSVFKIGKIDDLPIDSRKLYPEKNVLVMRDDNGIRAVSLVCTHLGCIVSEAKGGGWACPCHGSKFDAKGNVMGGPAPKGLKWLEVSQLPNGKLVVNAEKAVSEQTRFIV